MTIRQMPVLAQSQDTANPVNPAATAAAITIANAAATGAGSFVNAYVQNGELVVVVVSVNNDGLVSDVSYFDASTGDILRIMNRASPQ